MRSWVCSPWPHKNTAGGAWLAVTQCSYRRETEAGELLEDPAPASLVLRNSKRPCSKQGRRSEQTPGCPLISTYAVAHAHPSIHKCASVHIHICRQNSHTYETKKSKSPKPKWIIAINYKTRIEFPTILQIALNIFLSFCIFILYKVAFSIDNYKTKVSINSVKRWRCFEDVLSQDLIPYAKINKHIHFLSIEKYFMMKRHL